MNAPALPTPALVAAANDALFAASCKWAATPPDLSDVSSHMHFDKALAQPNDDGTSQVAGICFRHPASGLLGSVAYAEHVSRHGGEPTCVSCGKVIDAMAITPVPVGLGHSSGYRAMTVDGVFVCWTGGVEVRGAGVCADCRPPVPFRRAE